MVNASIKKLSQIHLKPLLYRKYVDIIAFGSLIVLCFMVVRTEFFKSFVIINAPYTTKCRLKAPEMTNTSSSASATENPLRAQMQAILKCQDIPLRQEKLQYGDYWLIKNYIRGNKSINMGCGESITYATNGDYTFMDNLATVVER